MKSVKLLFVLPSVFLLLSACTSSAVRSVSPPEISTGISEPSSAVSTEVHGGEVKMLYFTPENRLVLRNPDGAEQTLSEGKDGDAQLAYPTLHSDGKALYAIWRPKLTKHQEGVGAPGDKLIYVRASLDGGRTFGPTHRLNQKGGAFKPLVTSNGLGDVYVAYTDERNNGLDVYFNLSHNSGANWNAADIKLNDAAAMPAAIDPNLIAVGNRVHASWMTRSISDKKFKIVVRTSEDRGEHWLPPVVVFSSDNQPGRPGLINTASGLLLCWIDVGATRCSRSPDQNRTWGANTVIAGSDGSEGVFPAADTKGRAHLLIARKPANDERQRLNLFHTVSVDGDSFSSLQRISGGIPYGASNLLPVMRFGDDGSALAAWLDMRYHRPVIAGNYSADGGATWINDAIVLAGSKGLYHYFPAISYAGGGIYHIAWHQTANRRSPTSMIGTSSYRQGYTGVAMPLPDVARLKERVDAYWKTRETGNWALVYDYLDPFFREANSRDSYVKTQGLVRYFEHKLVGEPQITGQTAVVTVAYVSEVPEMVIRGKQISVPKKELESTFNWIWVDGDWYSVFTDIKNGTSLLD